MKKDKKTKENKNLNGAVKPKWKLWMTIVSVILGVGLITGLTILGVILARGGTKEKPVVPESISITYSSDIYNEKTSQLEVTDHFTLTITSPTDGVNKLEVELSLSVPEGETLRPSQENEIKYVSNSIIKVPQFVNINEPFTVKLDTRVLEDEEGNDITVDNKIVNWFKGGISTIFATSTENTEATSNIKVAVDVPVYSTETIILNSKGEETNQIILDEIFTLKTKFFPAESQYMFSDNITYAGDLNNENIRLKASFYGTNSNAITPIYSENGYDISFRAGEDVTSGVNITSYTFKNADDQINAEKDNADSIGENFYRGMLTTLASLDEDTQETIGSISNITISLGEASIGEFTVTNQNLSMNSSMPIRLYLNNPLIANSQFLSVAIRSTSGSLIEYMLKNIAINFEFNGQDPSLEGENQLLKVEGGEIVEIDGKTYYMPYSQVQNRNYSYWDITALDYLQENEKINISVVLLVETADEVYEIFEKSSQDVVYEVKLSIVEHIEQAVSWIDPSEIEVVLDYYDDGQIMPSNIDLSNRINIPQENIYKDYRFFAYFGDGETEQLIEIAKSVLGEGNINFDQSGLYPTTSGTLYLFVLNSSNLSLYNSGNFSLYYSSIVTINGVPSLDDQGRYNLAQMVASPISVKVSKGLNNDSVTNKEIDTANYDEEGAETTYIDQGNIKTFSLKFTVSAEMTEVFENELNQGFLSIKIYDKDNNDITSYFVYENPTFQINQETSEGILEYNLILNEGINLEKNVYLSSFELIYNNTDISRQVIWNQIIERNIAIYTPKAVDITIKQPTTYDYAGYITIKEQNQNESQLTTVVEQILTSNGFDLKIKVGESEFSTINQYFNSLFGDNFDYVVITDQNGKTETLKGKWEFVYVSDSHEGLNIDGQNINFTTADGSTVSLALKTTGISEIYSNAKVNGNVITFNITSTGITSAKKQISTNLDPYDTELLEDVENISNINVTKYGAVSKDDEIIQLKDYVKYFTNDGEYSNIIFKLSASYLNDTSSDSLQALFSDENGMITLYNGASPIKFSSLNSSTIVTGLKINKDFSTTQSISFTVTDANSATSAFSFAFNLTLSGNITISQDVTYGTELNPLYANSEIQLSNSVKFNNNNGVYNNLGGFYSNNTYYVVPATNQLQAQYMISIDKTGAIGEINNGSIKFYDFWDKETNDYSVIFTPQGNNTYSAKVVINFKVSRDLSVSLRNNTYYIYDNSIQTIGAFIEVKRASDGSNIDNLSIYATFDNYLQVEDGGNSISIKNRILFPYNQQSLSTNITVSLKIGDRTYNNIYTGIINIELFDTNDENTSVYEYIAKNQLNVKQIEGDKLYNAQTQIVDGVEYLILTNEGWSINSTININDQEINLSFSQIDMSGNNKQGICTILTDTISPQPQNKLLAGLNDQSFYLVATFENNNIFMYIPVIISSVGYDYVNYSKVNLDDKEKLAYALAQVEYETFTGVNALIALGIYDEINAGQLTQILSQYSLNDYFVNTNLGNGLFILSNYGYNVEYFPVSTSENVQTSEDVVKLINQEPVNGQSSVAITLNHLTSDYENFYLVLKYTVSSITDSQVFYYVLKVNPDVVNENPIYAYNGSTEYIEDTSNPIDLDELFDSTTLNSGYSRFNISKNIELLSVVDSENTETLIDKLDVLVTENAKIKFSATIDEKNIEVIQSYNIPDGETSLQTTVNLSDIFLEEGQTTSLSKGDIVNIMILSGKATISYNGKQIFKNLRYTHEVASVEVDGQIITDSSYWKNFVNIYFDGSDMYVDPISANQMTVTIKRSYSGGDGSNELSVIGGDQYYKFIINASTHNYSVSITGDNENLTQDYQGNYIWTITNDKYSEEDFNLTIYLKENAIAGSAESGTTIWDQLEINLTKGEIGKDLTNFNYDSSADNNGKFTLTREDYLSSDREIEFTLYTQYGYLATLIVKLEANAEFKLKGNFVNKEIEGGTNPKFNDIFNISMNGKDAKIKSISMEAKGNGEKFIILNLNDSDYVFTIADLFYDEQVTLTFTITFDDNNNNQFIFTQDFILKANVELKTSVQGPTVVAGSQFDFTKDNAKATIEFFSKNPNSNSTITYTGNTTSNAVANNSNCITTGNEITTNYVNSITSVTVTVTVKLEFNGANQTKTFTYNFIVYPSVKLEPNYPQPNSTDILTSEYVDDNATYNNVIDNFFNHNAVFSNNKRLVVRQGEVDTKGVVNYRNQSTDLSDLQIIIKSLDNASISNATKHFQESELVALSDSITFHLGTYNGNDTYTDSGKEAKIVFTLRYQEVERIYEVIIQKNSLSVNINTSKYNETGNYQEEGEEIQNVNYDILYVDKTSTSNIFGKNRLFAVKTNAGISLNGNYFVVFGQGTQDNYGKYEKYYSTYPIFITPLDGGKESIIYDLGYSLPDNLTYLGLYADSAFDDQFLMTDATGVLKVNTSHQDYDPTLNGGDILKALTNMTNVDYNKAIFGTTRLTSRVELVYGNYYVDYDKYSANIGNNGASFDITPNPSNIDKGLSENTITSFNRNDGSTETTTFSNTTYYYKLCLDIDVENQINSSAGNIVTLTVNQENNSLVDLVRIVHPTSGNTVISSDFGEGRAELYFDLITYSSRDESGFDENTKTKLNYYLTAYNMDSFELYKTEGYNYMSYSARLNSSMTAYDYTLFPEGAQLNGNYVLGKIIYSSNGFTKTYYVVMKIEPDYIVTFDGSSENATRDEDTGIISNVDNVYNISTLVNNDGTITYKTFIITGDSETDTSTEKSIISVKHANGNNTTLELSTYNFDLKFPASTTIDGQTYNDSTNMGQKLSASLTSTSWVKEGSSQVYKYRPKSSAGEDEIIGSTNRTATKISGAKEVIFGSQYFYVEGEDNYGYKFQVYFSLQSSYGIPTVEQGGERIRLEELSSFDVGANFELVSIADKNDQGYSVTSVPTSPSSSADVEMIKVSGIEAYLFDKDYGDSSDELNYYLVKKGDTNGGYTAKEGENNKWTEETKEYFETALVEYITVDNVKFYDLDGNILSFLSDTGSSIDKIIPIANENDSIGYTLATSDTSKGYYNSHSGYEARNIYPAKPDEDNTTGDETSGGETETEIPAYYALQIPRFTDTDIFGNTSTANLTMTIKLKYSRGEIIEYYDLKVDITVVREVTIETQKQAAVIDGQSFVLADQFRLSSGEFEDNNSENHIEFVNDTLEILVNKTSTTTFSLKVVRGNEVFTGISSATNNSNVQKTVYQSISQIIGTNLKKGDKVTIIPNDESAEFYYITNDTDKNIANNHFTVGFDGDSYITTAQNSINYNDFDFYASIITEDAIYIENAALLEGARYYTVTKYYVVNVNFDPGDTATQDGGLREYMSYRTQKTYDVTGTYYNIGGATTAEIIRAIVSSDSGNTSSFDQWKAGIAAKSRNENGTESTTLFKSDNLIFTLNKLADTGISGGTLGSGNATIDENGTITFNQYFNYNQYIKLVIGMYVSGTDRDITKHEENELTYNFSPIRLAWKQDYANETMLINTSINGTLKTIRVPNNGIVGNLGKQNIEGYTFVGWSSSENGYILEDSEELIANSTYYAIYSVSIIVGEEQQTYTSSNPNSLTIEKLGEGNWELKDGNGEILPTNTLLINGATYNKYEGNTINITLSINGTTQNKVYEENRTIADLTTPTIDGYTFVGWSLSENGETLSSETSLVDGTTYYAVLSENNV